MYQEPEIVTLKAKKLIGQSVKMSLIDNKTFELFSSFMPKRKEIKNTLGTDVHEVMVYSNNHFKKFSPANTFQKWAMFEVSNYNTIPENMTTLDIEKGLFLVFKYKGLPQGFGNLMNYIFTEWLPKSIYQLDNRPHFNVLGENYKKDSPESEEDVFIPIKLK